MLSKELRIFNSEVAETIARVEHSTRERIPFDSILSTLDFSVEKVTPSPEAVKELEELDMYLYDKIPLLLAALGEKPASFVGLISKTWEEKESAIFDEQTSDIISVAQKLGLQTQVIDRTVHTSRDDGFMIRYINTSLSLENLTVLSHVINPKNSTEELVLGKVLGFPDTAVVAYVSQENVLPLDNHPYTNDKQRIFGSFRMSQGNVATELLTVDRWAQAIKQSSPLLYDQVSI